MKRFLLLLVVFTSFIHGAEAEAEVKAGIAADQVARFRELAFNPAFSYEAIAGGFFTQYNYKLFIGPDSPLKGLCLEVRTALEEKRKKFRGTKGSGYRRLQLVHSFLAVAQEKDPHNAYQTELAEEGNVSLRNFNGHVLDSGKLTDFLEGKKWAANATVLVVAQDVAQRRKAFDAKQPKRVYED